MVDCKAVGLSEEDELFWVTDNKFLEKNESLSIFYNYTR